MERKTILLAAGGTGGHLYPAEALAQELLARGHEVVIVTDKRGSAFQKLGDRVRIDCVRAATFKPGLVKKIRAAADIALGILQAARLLKNYRPAIVVGFGGYPSFPAVFAAQRLGYATLLHEQNAVLGKANRWLAAAARTLAVSLPDTQGIAEAWRGKVAVTGNPVRPGVCAVRDKAYPAFMGVLDVLITGGSQGARVFSEVVPAAVGLLPADVRHMLHIVHQCREEDADAAAAKYRAAGVGAEIKPFFHDMPERLAACHLFIGRSGASTVAEIAVAGRPAIFAPLRHADLHQFLNAGVIVGRGGGWILPPEDFTPQNLAQRLEELAKSPAVLENAAKAARACGQPEAVRKLADLVEEKLRL